MKHLLTILFLFCLCTLSVAGQGITRQKCAVCGKLKVQCPGHEKTCTSCGKVISKCPYNGNHPKPQPTEKTCASCGKIISKCPYKGKHPAPEPSGYDVKFSCNAPSATIFVDDRNYGTPNGSVYLKTGAHRVKVTADGYEDYSSNINVGKSSTSFRFDLKMNVEAVYKKGESLYKEKKYEEAVLYFRRAAERNNAEAYYMLGQCYEIGQGVPKDNVEALRNMKKAAELDAGCAVLLGVRYEAGENVPKDSKEAMRWYRSAANRGDELGQLLLAESYYNGELVTKDYAEAVVWYKKVAEKGHAGAQFKLGACYLEGGNGVQQNYIDAAKWFREAAEQGHSQAQFFLGALYKNGKGVKQDKTEAIKWYRLAAKQGESHAQERLRAMGITEW